MNWRREEPVIAPRGVWIRAVKVALDEVEVGDLYGMQDQELDAFRIQRVIAINPDYTLTVEDKWSHQVKSVKVDVLVRPDYSSVPTDPTPLHWGRPVPLCKDDYNHRYG